MSSLVWPFVLLTGVRGRGLQDTLRGYIIRTAHGASSLPRFGPGSRLQLARRFSVRLELSAVCVPHLYDIATYGSPGLFSFHS